MTLDLMVKMKAGYGFIIWASQIGEYSLLES